MSETEYEQAIRKKMEERPEPEEVLRFSGLDTRLLILRPSFVHIYSFAIPNEQALAEIAKHGPILEVGAGSGYWAYELRKRGVDVLATDPWPPSMTGNHYQFEKEWSSVLQLGAVESVHANPDRTLLIVWPCYDNPWAAEALDAYEGKVVIYVGENGGCCADDRFHKFLATRFEESACLDIPQWYGIHDWLWVYERREDLQ